MRRSHSIQAGATAIAVMVMSACSDGSKPEQCDDCVGPRQKICDPGDLACCFAFPYVHPPEHPNWPFEIVLDQSEMVSSLAPELCDWTATDRLAMSGVLSSLGRLPFDSDSPRSYDLYAEFCCRNPQDEALSAPVFINRRGEVRTVERNGATIVKGLDIFPFIENEEFVINAAQSHCTEYGGTLIQFELTGSDIPLAVTMGGNDFSFDGTCLQE